METTIELQQYNQQATKAFVEKAIKESANPEFVEMQLNENWPAAYNTIVMFKTTIPKVVEHYNKEYYKVLIKSN